MKIVFEDQRGPKNIHVTADFDPEVKLQSATPAQLLALDVMKALSTKLKAAFEACDKPVKRASAKKRAK